MDKQLMKQAVEKYVEAAYEEAFASVLSKYIAAEVIKRYNERQIRTAAFFTGALLDVDLAIEGLAHLQGEGFSICAILTPAAEKLIGVDKLKKALKTGEVYTTEKAPATAWQQAELIVIPTLTVNTAAKIAAGISDCYVADAISKCIMMGKTIISTVDGACPVAKQRMEKYRGKIPQTYADMLSANLDAMRAFGIDLCYSKNLCKKVYDVACAKLRTLGGGSVAATAPSTAHAGESGVSTIKRRLIGASDVANLPAGSKIRVATDAIVTELARDIIKKNSIELIRDK